MMTDGVLTLCTLENMAEPGLMPVEKLVPGDVRYFERRTVGYGRQYAAKGVNEQVDLLVRVWDCTARIGMYTVVSQSPEAGQYRIDNVQNLTNDDGLRVTDLTLSRLDDLYEVYTE